MSEINYKPETDDDIEWSVEEAERLKQFDKSDISTERWERVRWSIDFYDLTISLFEDHKLLRNHKGNKVSCPFHGGVDGDSTPSFTFYPGTNSAWCFGCEAPASNQFYDNVRLVSLLFGISKRDALVWLERKYNLPPMEAPKRAAKEDDGEEEEEEEEPNEKISLTFDDLREPFLAMTSVLDSNVTRAKELLHIYFTAEHEKDPLPLAKVLGKKRIVQILTKKVNNSGR